jgi:predicted nucleic acid-binding protein
MAKEEVRIFLEKKMPGVLPIYRKYLPLLHLEIAPLPPPEALAEFKGQVAEKDLPVLASAVRAETDFLVTGDRKDFARARRMRKDPPRIVSPGELLDSVLPEILRLLEAG